VIASVIAPDARAVDPSAAFAGLEAGQRGHRVLGLLPVRFPGPLAEPAMPITRQRALHGLCRQVVAGAQGGPRTSDCG
jgi:hypothetical protein